MLEDKEQRDGLFRMVMDKIATTKIFKNSYWIRSVNNTPHVNIILQLKWLILLHENIRWFILDELPPDEIKLFQKEISRAMSKEDWIDFYKTVNLLESFIKWLMTALDAMEAMNDEQIEDFNSNPINQGELKHETNGAQTGLSEGGKKKNKRKSRQKIDDCISNLIPYFATPTAKGYEGFLNLNQNCEVFIQKLDTVFAEEIEFKDNIPYFIGTDLKPTLRDLRTKKDITLDDIDAPLLKGIYSIVCQNINIENDIDNNFCKITQSNLAKFLGINIRGEHGNELMKKLRQFKDIIVTFKNGSFYNLLYVSSYDRETDIITLDIGYMNKLIRDEIPKGYERERKVRGSRSVKYISPHHSYLIHSNIANEKNKNAVCVVERIVTLLQQAGGKVNPHITFNKIIEDTPTFKITLEELPTANKNTILKRTFSKVYQLLKTKTDIYKYYTDLELLEMIPTSSTLDIVLEFKHNGINKEYKQAK